MNLDKIQKNGEKAIEYFRFKLDFAKNPTTHGMYLNHLITFYNTFDQLKNYRTHSRVIDGLILELLRLKFREYEGDLPSAVREIGHIIDRTYPIMKSDLKLEIDMFLYKNLYNELSTIEDFKNWMQDYNENFVDEVINEALTVLKQGIEWS